MGGTPKLITAPKQDEPGIMGQTLSRRSFIITVALSDSDWPDSPVKIDRGVTRSLAAHDVNHIPDNQPPDHLLRFAPVWPPRRYCPGTVSPSPVLHTSRDKLLYSAYTPGTATRRWPATLKATLF